MSNKNEHQKEMCPGDKLFNEMTEVEFDKAVKDVLTKMRTQYRLMTTGDLQSIAMFVSMFKAEHLKSI